MPNETRDQKHDLGHQVRAPVPPQSDESKSSHDRGLVVTLWLLTLLIAEIEFWMFAFAHMYRM